MYTFNEIIAATEGKYVNFYGVDGNTFKIGNVVFEALEDEKDGYRSSLDKVVVSTQNNVIFSECPLSQVKLIKTDSSYHSFSSHSFVGYALVDKQNHTWLEVGTDNYDDYYPCFIFRYLPEPVVSEPVVSEIIDAIFER